LSGAHSELPLTTLPLHLCIPSKLAPPIAVLQLGSVLLEFDLYQFNFSTASFSTYSEQSGIQITILIKILLPLPNLHCTHTFNHLKHGWILLQHEMSSITAIIKNHVWLPIFCIHTFVYTPPEIFFCFSTP